MKTAARRAYRGNPIQRRRSKMHTVKSKRRIAANRRQSWNVTYKRYRL